MKKILHIVNPNGNGHLKRASLMCRSIPEYCENAYFIIDQSHVTSLGAFGFSGDLHYEVWDLSGAITVNNILQTDFRDKYFDLQKRLRMFAYAFPELSIVISDNILFDATFFNCRIIILGSFLWHECISINEYDIHVNELRLSLQKNFTFVGISDVVNFDTRMRNYTGIGWLASIKLKVGHERSKVLFGGGFFLDNLIRFQSLYILLIEYFSLKGFELISVDNKHDLFSDFPRFTYETSSFEQIKFIVGRPGIGIVTEAIENRCFFIALGESENKEIVSNAEFLSRNRIGVNLVSLDFSTFELQFGNLSEESFGRFDLDGLKQLKQIIYE